MPERVDLKSWLEFEQYLTEYFALKDGERRRFIFRGQSRALSWKLTPTLDRMRASTSPDDRAVLLAQLISQFKVQSVGFGGPLGAPADPQAWELLGRHHGLPTTILDWTYSPYVAAFFAFSDDGRSDEPVAIYVWDRGFLTGERPGESPVELLESYEHMWFNIRAVEQAAVSMKVNYLPQPLEEVLGSSLAVLTIPSAERTTALTRLQAMRITDRNLYRDMDHAARTAEWLARRMEATT